MIAFPVVHVKNREPELAPRRCAKSAAELVQARAGFDSDWVICFHAEDADRAVVQRGAEDRTWTLSMTANNRVASDYCIYIHRCGSSSSTVISKGMIGVNLEPETSQRGSLHRAARNDIPNERFSISP